MCGEEVIDSEEEDQFELEKDIFMVVDGVFVEEELEDFGFGGGIKMCFIVMSFGFDDEDDFFIEDGFVVSGLEIEDFSDEGDEDEDVESGEEGVEDDEEEEEDDFVKGLFNDEEFKNFIFGFDVMIVVMVKE